MLACAMFDATATTIPLSRRVVSDITLPPASSPLTLSAFVAAEKRTRSDDMAYSGTTSASSAAADAWLRWKAERALRIEGAIAPGMSRPPLTTHSRFSA